MVTSTQINGCTDKATLFLALTGANGDRPMESGEHWGEPILAGDPIQPIFPPWGRAIKWFWYFWYTEIEPTGSYRLCDAGYTTVEEALAGNLEIAAELLGAALSISRNQGESDEDYAQRLLCEKLAGEQA